MNKLLILPFYFIIQQGICQNDSILIETSFKKFINDKTLISTEYSAGFVGDNWTLKPYRINKEFYLILEINIENETSSTLQNIELNHSLQNKNIQFLYLKLDDKDVLILPSSSNIYENEIRYSLSLEYMTSIVNAQAISIKFSSIKTNNYSDFQYTASNNEMLNIKYFGIGTKLIEE